METDFFNFQLGSIASPYYNQGGLEDSESSILDNLQNDFSYEPSSFEGSATLWDADGELSSDIPTLSMGSLDGSFSRGDTGYKEDFHKLLTDWNEHLGSLQVSDEEEIDVKDMVKISENLPEDIFDDSMERRSYLSGMSPKGRSRVKRIIRSDVKLERSVDGRIDVDGDSQIECIDNMMSLDEPEVKIPSFADDGLLFVPEQPDFLFGDCEDDENISKMNAVKVEPESGRGSPSGSSIEVEEDCVDVETVSGPVPVLQAGDLTSLLEQFEASEAVNGASPSSGGARAPGPVSKSVIPTVPTNFPSAPVSSSPLKGSKGPYGASLPATPLMTNQKIRDSLPIEIIEKIKACGRKKPISVIPAMPSKRNGQRGTRMQDAGATLSRNKLLKIVSGGQLGGGESVQLDHDYCSSEMARPPSFYHSDASEYASEACKSRRGRKETTSGALPTVGSNARSIVAKPAIQNPPVRGTDPSQTVSQVGAVDRRVTGVVKNISDRSRKLDVGCCYEKNSKKDSGLESGEVSDAGEEAGSCPTVSELNPDKHSIGHPDEVDGARGTVPSAGSQEHEVQKPKRKLNLQEYRSRRSELEKQKVYPCEVQLSEIPMPKEDPSGMSDVVSAKVDVVSEASVNTEANQSEVPEQKVSEDASSEKPKMHSVEVQTKCSEEKEKVPDEKSPFDDQKRAARSRDRRRRNYRSHHRNRNDSASSNSSVLSHSSYGSVSSCSSRSSSTSSMNQGRGRRHRHHRGNHSCHCRSGHSHKGRRHNSRARSVGGKGSSHHMRRSSSMQHGHSQVKSPSSLTSCGSSPSSSLRSITPSSHSPSPHRSGDRQSRRRNRRRSHKDAEVRRRSCRSHSSRSPSWSSDCSSCYSRSRSPIHGAPHRAKSNSSSCGLAALPPSSDWQPGIEREKIRQVEERRVIYVGRLAEGTTKADLRHRFEVFGEIIDISVHFREHGDNYGFVTFAYKVDAYEAVEHGNDDPTLPKYDLCFGGRRAFCKVRYSDLDAMSTWSSSGGGFKGSGVSRVGDDSFDSLLREAQAKIRKRQV
ncbi:uncharacterized protein LOC124154201 isoform X2 [Ischnura elegans]|uniref:uncharacterized protein LOC124154201 isoform X2 n=1 Tax=Ischnura elegans TaxID=197161 RepID=UPI001ED8AA4D|nr:uncharacterized protein LOC124154201 isoform X2 [Ischnura elegans]